MKEQTKPAASNKQSGIVVAELLFAVATLSAAILVGAMGGPKIPVATGE